MRGLTTGRMLREVKVTKRNLEEVKRRGLIVCSEHRCIVHVTSTNARVTHDQIGGYEIIDEVIRGIEYFLCPIGERLGADEETDALVRWESCTGWVMAYTGDPTSNVPPEWK